MGSDYLLVINEILDDAMVKVGGPALEASLKFLRDRHPLVMKILCWKYRKKLEKFRQASEGFRRL